MSIYDDFPPNAAASEATGKPPVTAGPVAPQKKRGWGCGSCLAGCAVVSLVCAALLVAGGVLVWKKLPDWTRDTLVAAVEDSDLPEADKQAVVAQLDRVYEEYKSGTITLQQLGLVAEQLAESPLLTLGVAYAATENYVAPSGLSDEEKEAARLTLQRVARGVYQEQIDPERLDPALDYISTEDFNGQRKFNNRVSDDDLREMLAECRRLADSAGVSDEPFEVDVGGELKRAVDRALDQAM